MGCAISCDNRTPFHDALTFIHTLQGNIFSHLHSSAICIMTGRTVTTLPFTRKRTLLTVEGKKAKRESDTNGRKTIA